MIDRNQAAEIARREVARTPAPAGDRFVLLEDKTLEKPFGWVFFHTSERYRQTRDLRHAVPGNAPLIVDREDGSVHTTGTGRPLQFYLDRYERERGGGR